MDIDRVTPEQVRASDTERERVAAMLQQAGAEGRLTLAEVDERVAAAFAATYRRELTPLTRDLPAPPANRPQPGPVADAVWRSRGLRIHAVIAAAISVLVLVRWAGTGAGFFWPIFPMLWAWGTLAARIAWQRGGFGGLGPRTYGPRWADR